MKEFLKQHKGKAIVSSLLILLPSLVGLLLWEELPQSLTTHWNMDGVAGGTGTKAFAVFGLPLIMLALQWLCLLVTAKDPGQKGQSPKALGMVFWIMPMVSLVAEGVVYAGALGQQVGIRQLVQALLGVMFTVMGNYLPKVKRNSTLGIKTTWALHDEENWTKTHRFGGRVWFIGGLVILVSLLLPGDYVTFGVMIGVILVLAFAPLVYSWALYRKQKQAGTYEDQWETSRFQKIWGIVGIAVALGVLILAGVLMTTGDIQFQVRDQTLTIEADYYDDLTIDLDQVQTIEYRENQDLGVRTFGFGSARLMMGTFENEEFGAYTRYTYTNNGPCIVLTVDGETVVLGCRTAEQTEELYRELEGSVGDLRSR